MTKNIYNVSLLDIMPQSLINDPFAKAIAMAIDPELQAISEEINLSLIWHRIDELPEDIIDLLAWQLHCDFYESDLPLETKRALVKGSIPWHRHKGTPWAVEQVVSAVFGNGKVTEWFEYGGEPYFFRVETAGPLRNENDIPRLVKLIKSTKNTRSWLDQIIVTRTIDTSLNLGFVVSENRITDIYPKPFVMPVFDGMIHMGCIFTPSSNHEIYPKEFKMPDLNEAIYVGCVLLPISNYEICPEIFIMPGLTQGSHIGCFIRSWKTTKIYPGAAYSVSILGVYSNQ